MIDTQLLDRLRQIVGSEHVSAGKVEAELYSYDGSTASHSPDATAFPADTLQTAEVVRVLAEAGVPFVPRGFGTNLSGGSVAVHGGVVIGLSRLRHIGAIEVESRTAVVQAGVTNLELQNALAPRGYFYAPDPASQKVATIGGNVGENSGGPHCLKYGVTTNHVLGVTAVLPDGEILSFGGPGLDAPGLDLRGVLVGSEGTLGIVTEAVVRILPIPEDIVTLLAIYDSVAAAAQSVSDIIAAGMVPATLEMMDAPVIRAVEESIRCGYPLDAEATLIIEVDGPSAGLRTQASRIEEICRQNGCRTVREAADAAERDLLWAGRRGAFGAVARLAPNYLVNDGTVPRSRLPEALERVAEIARRHELLVGNVFHAGDGNLHPLLLFDSRREDEVRRVEAAGWEIMEACLALGGTISGEHGIGVEKLEALRMVFSEESLGFQRSLKQAFDPNGLLNPGKVVPEAAANGSPEETGASPPAADLVPGTAAEACDLVRSAAQNQVALLPMGGGSRVWPHYEEGREVVRLRSTGLDSLIEHDHVNQVVAVQAGHSLADLQEAIRGHGQWIPLRPPLGDRCTIGGVVALGACGPDRLKYGAPRDLLLGLEFVSGAGHLISAGGRVVKNVAGYDITRLLAGSGGALGFLTSVVLRSYSLPESCLVQEGRGSLDQCTACARELLSSSLEPAFAVAVTDGPGYGRDSVLRFCVGWEGPGDTVAAQTEQGRMLLSREGLGAITDREYRPGDDPLAAHHTRIHAADLVIRAGLPLGSTGTLLEAEPPILCQADLMVDFGCGQVTAGAPELADEEWDLVCSRTRQAKGHIALGKAPAAFARRHGAYGPRRREWELMRRIKSALDPDGVFAAGSLPGEWPVHG